jgi:drug/metabolite transporter (DMT)-like permease|tara:strand:+ start:856 stop:1725 length:870 start_codon:yes stop_codon:yes gene_type:complete
MKILFLGILLACLNAFTGSTFDTITKYLSINNYKWYHYYSIGGTVALFTLVFFLIIQGNIQNHILLKKKVYYFLPLARGLNFIFVLITIFYALKYIPINIFTILLMTTPFFLVIFAKLVLKEKLNLISWIAIIIGFCGVLIVLRPNSSNINIYFFLVLLVAVSNALSFTLVSKYSHIASTYGFTFYGYAPLVFVSYIFFLNDPIFPSGKEFFLFSCSGVIMMISMWAFNAAYHVAGKYSSIISPFFFTQIIWGTLYGAIFFSEKISFTIIIGIIIIVVSGSIAIYNRNK